MFDEQFQKVFMIPADNGQMFVNCEVQCQQVGGCSVYLPYFQFLYYVVVMYRLHPKNVSSGQNTILSVTCRTTPWRYMPVQVRYEHQIQL